MLLAVSIGLGIVGVALAIDGFSGRPFTQLVMGNWSAPKPATSSGAGVIA